MMKNYIKLQACVIELQAKENIALNPIAATVDTAMDGTTTTTYDLSIFSAKSVTG